MGNSIADKHPDWTPVYHRNGWCNRVAFYVIAGGIQPGAPISRLQCRMPDESIPRVGEMVTCGFCHMGMTNQEINEGIGVSPAAYQVRRRLEAQKVRKPRWDAAKSPTSG